MDIFDYKLYDRESFKKMFEIMDKAIESIQNKNIFEVRNIMSYEEFINIVKSFIFDIASNYNDKYACATKIVDDIDGLSSACFNSNENVIELNEKMLKILYKKPSIEEAKKSKDIYTLMMRNNMDLERFIKNIFHELYHYKISIDKKLGVLSVEVRNSTIESLIRTLSAKESLKYFNYNENTDSYYKDNYEYNYEECLARINSYEGLKFFYIGYCKYRGLSDDDISYSFTEINDDIEKETKIYNNIIRNFSSTLLPINSFYADLNEIFNIFIKDHPEWLEIPIISIEYYINEDGIIVQRNKEQLYELANQNEEYRKYIESLIKRQNMDKKRNEVYKSI